MLSAAGLGPAISGAAISASVIVGRTFGVRGNVVFALSAFSVIVGDRTARLRRFPVFADGQPR